MNKIKCSAPSKLMLLGEYAVLYNKPCLVTTLNKRLYASVEIIDKPELQLEAPDVGLTKYKKPIARIGIGDIPKGAKFVEMAVKNTLRHSGKSRRVGTHPESLTNVRDSGVAPISSGLPRMTIGVRITTKSEFYSHYGFGSSAAATVCVIKALSELFNLNLPKKEIFDISYKTVLDVQGRGSGFDVAASVYGGTLYFVSGGKIIESLNITEIPLVVGHSGIKGDTVELISRAKDNFSNRKSRLEEIYDGIEDLVNQGKEELIKMDWEKFGELMNRNQEYLRELGVSTPKLNSMIRAALNANAYGAKLSGAGGGDSMIVIVSSEKRERVEVAIKRAGGEVVDVETNAEGVRTE